MPCRGLARARGRFIPQPMPRSFPYPLPRFIPRQCEVYPASHAEVYPVSLAEVYPAFVHRVVNYILLTDIIWIFLRTSHDIVIEAPLNDDFRLADARVALGTRMPFIETIIQQHMSTQLGLGAKNIATMAQREAFKQQDIDSD